MRMDEIDRRILAILRRDGRITNKDLALTLGVSQSTCLDRVRRLERAGIILGYHARITLEPGSPIFDVWANIRLLDLPLTTQRSVDKLIEASVYVVEVVHMTAPLDCLIHFVSADASAWRSFCCELSSIGVHHERFSFGVVTNHQKRDVR